MGRASFELETLRDAISQVTARVSQLERVEKRERMMYFLK